MIILTGAAGFIGSCMASYLNNNNHRDLVLVDDFTNPDKEANLTGKSFALKLDRTELEYWLDDNARDIDFIIHIGARTDTTEFDKNIFNQLNLTYTKMLWKKCCTYKMPLVYASSAATYGDGSFGYDDKHDGIAKFEPLNPYGQSKQDFDVWALSQDEEPPFWAGLKFFNIYGPNEYHKGRMASVIFHAFNQIQSGGSLKLFRSHREDYEDGKQLRDFCYVEDVLKVLYFMFENRPSSGIYNLGTGNARTFLDLGKQVFTSLGLSKNIQFIDTPIDIRDKYQYFTEAKMEKLRSVGYPESFYSLEEGVDDYVKNYLLKEKYY